MALSKEQANAIFDALTATARQEHERQIALRELKKRRIMPLRWRLVALLAGLAVGALLYGALLYWFAFAQRSLWVVSICMFVALSYAQFRWNRHLETVDRIDSNS